MTTDAEAKEWLSRELIPRAHEVARAIEYLRVRLQHGELGTSDESLVAGAFGIEKPGGDYRVALNTWPESALPWADYHRARRALLEAAAALVAQGEALPTERWWSTGKFEVAVPFVESKGSTTRRGDLKPKLPALIVPSRIAPSAAYRESSGALSSASAYVALALGQIDASREVRRALAESVEAYRRGLYLASGVMLGSASEGAWFALAGALADRPEGARIKSALDERLPSNAKVQQKVKDVLDQHYRTEVRAAGLTIDELVSRADYLRTLRNYAHPSKAQLPAPDFESIGVALFASARYFRGIYELRSHVIARRNENST